MNFILKVKDQNVVVPLNEPQLLWTAKGFNRNWPLVILITGWTSSTDDSSNQVLDKIYAAYRCRGGHNFVVNSLCLLQNIVERCYRIFC